MSAYRNRRELEAHMRALAREGAAPIPNSDRDPSGRHIDVGYAVTYESPNSQPVTVRYARLVDAMRHRLEMMASSNARASAIVLAEENGTLSAQGAQQ